jgi:predicted Zn-dependent protease
VVSKRIACEALREKASTDLQLGNVSAALSLATAYTADNPFDPVGHDVLGTAYAASGARLSAERELSAAQAGYRARHDNIGIGGVQSQLALLESATH